MKEEKKWSDPVGDTLTEAAADYAHKQVALRCYELSRVPAIKRDFTAGAEWQKKQMMNELKDRIEAVTVMINLCAVKEEPYYHDFLFNVLKRLREDLKKLQVIN